METPKIKLNKEECPILSKMDEEKANEILDNLVLKANPSKKLEDITEANKEWSARMLEMDLYAEKHSIPDWDEEDEIEEQRKLQEEQKLREELENQPDLPY